MSPILILEVGALKITGHVGIPSSELITTVPLWPGLRVLTVPLELNSRVRVAPSCAASDPQELGGTTPSLSPCEQSGSKVTSLIFVRSGSSRWTRGVSSASAGEGSPAPYGTFSLTMQ